MAELAIVIRHTVLAYKVSIVDSERAKDSVLNSRRHNESSVIQTVDRGEDQYSSPHFGDRQEQDFVAYRKKLWAVYIGCTMAACASLCCGAYMIWYTVTQKYAAGSTNLVEAICSFASEVDSWVSTSQIMASTFLALLSIGLIGTYSILIHHMVAYFKEQMRGEMRRLTVLFATFVVAYSLRFVYQLGLGNNIYATIVP